MVLILFIDLYYFQFVEVCSNFFYEVYDKVRVGGIEVVFRRDLF